ncbi:F-box protein SKIP23-like protein [Carex littledalei]|uniref:F-box protein SKIP23-like protein n=1 Tax=Carex littledalei TaxID=544730 RepID=A0A833R7P4_9POAL|nr:F-box protein SKIP23-like protein [Carex littledalei]
MLKPMLKKKIQCPTHVATRSSSSLTLSTSDWANLPEDIVDAIMKKMCYVDLSTFRAVCKSWRLMYINRSCCIPRNIPLGVPMLLFNACKPYSNSHKFVKMGGEITSNDVFMPEAANKWVCGSSLDWIVLAGVGTDGIEVNLLNPFTRRVIRLPSVDTFTMNFNCFPEPDVPLCCFSYIHKAILSTNPAISEQDCIIMAIVGTKRKLSYCRIGDKRWTNVEGSLQKLSDVIYYEGKFYATTDDDGLISCNIMDPNSTETVSILTLVHSRTFTSVDKRYLVMASGCLLLVSRADKYRFEVHSLRKLKRSRVQSPSRSLQIPNEVEIWYEWIEIDSIGDQLLFVGNNGSFALPVQGHGGRANCIYFREDFGNLPGHLHEDYTGRYDIGKKSTTLYNGYAHDDELLPSFWVNLTPW